MCRSRKNNVNLLDEMDYLEDSSEQEESPDGNMRLLHVATLKMNGIKDRQNSCENSEWSYKLATAPSTVNLTPVPMQV